MASPMSTRSAISSTRRLTSSAAEAVEARLEPEQLSARLLGVESGLLQRGADPDADGVGLGYDVVSGDPGAPRRRQQQRGEHAQHGRLAGAVGPEKAVYLAVRDGEVYRVDGLDAAKVSCEAVGLDSKIVQDASLRVTGIPRMLAG